MEKEIKNTNPAVGTKPGGGGKEELVDENSRYTAGNPGAAQNPETPTRPTRSIDQANRQVDKSVYTPLFENVSEKIFGVKAKRGSKAQDKIGIDFEVLPEPQQGDDFIFYDISEKDYYSIDLKGVDDSLGDEEYYKNPNITINLFKTFDNEDRLETIDKTRDLFHTKSQEIMSGEFHPGSFTNGKHSNNTYGYIYPHCLQTRQEILNGVVPDIDEARIFLIKTKALNRYVKERIFNNLAIKNVIGYYTRNRLAEGNAINREIYKIIKGSDLTIKQNNPNSIRILIPVAGENFSAELHMRIKSNRVRDVRLYLPAAATRNPELKKYTIHKIISLK